MKLQHYYLCHIGTKLVRAMHSSKTAAGTRLGSHKQETASQIWIRIQMDPQQQSPGTSDSFAHLTDMDGRASK